MDTRKVIFRMFHSPYFLLPMFVASTMSKLFNQNFFFLQILLLKQHYQNNKWLLCRQIPSYEHWAQITYIYIYIFVICTSNEENILISKSLMLVEWIEFLIKIRVFIYTYDLVEQLRHMHDTWWYRCWNINIQLCCKCAYAVIM